MRSTKLPRRARAAGTGSPATSTRMAGFTLQGSLHSRSEATPPATGRGHARLGHVNDPLAPHLGAAAHAFETSGSPASSKAPLAVAESPPPSPAAPRAPEQLLLPLANIAGGLELAPVGVRIETRDRVFVNRDLNLAKID